MEPRARDLYATYCASSGGKNFQGHPCPAWDELPEPVRGHWVAVALRADELAADNVDPGHETEAEPGNYVTEHLPDRGAALAVWRRYSGIEAKP